MRRGGAGGEEASFTPCLEESARESVIDSTGKR